MITWNKERATRVLKITQRGEVVVVVSLCHFVTVVVLVSLCHSGTVGVTLSQVSPQFLVNF